MIKIRVPEIRQLEPAPDKDVEIMPFPRRGPEHTSSHVDTALAQKVADRLALLSKGYTREPDVSLAQARPNERQLQ